MNGAKSVRKWPFSRGAIQWCLTGASYRAGAGGAIEGYYIGVLYRGPIKVSHTGVPYTRSYIQESFTGVSYNGSIQGSHIQGSHIQGSFTGVS
jgi:hypothetical protein